MKRFRDTNYYVSEDGKVFRKWGDKMKQKTPQMVRTYKDGKVIKNKYEGMYLYQKSKGTFYLIHRLVGELYVDNPDNLPQVDHIDNNRFNNHYTNLEWVSNEENMKRAVEAGLMKRNGRKKD
jgi:hypothetical protein